MDVFCFFFFKQKTAYEMRISDWSSDVCSSDLSTLTKAPIWVIAGYLKLLHPGQGMRAWLASRFWRRGWGSAARRTCTGAMRSEEHTSELQSLLRISYAVCCLKKKTTNSHQDR